MRILADRRIKQLFGRVLLAVLLFTLLSAVLAAWQVTSAPLLAALCALGLGLTVLALLWQYFRRQSQVLEQAIERIRDYSAGNSQARIDCDEEGELYRLFHEVNVLAGILNAHAENEGREKAFMKDTISDISHQLKTPLAALNIYNGLLQQETENAPVLKEFTELSEQELNRMETLVQNLLKITKLDAGTVLFEKSEENVAEMMERIERHFACRARQEGKRLSLSGEEDVTLFCDRTWLLEAVSNIVKNAFDHTGEGEEIRIAWRRFASVVQLTVSDDGSGIHPEDLPHIFKRFYRSRFSKDTAGIGLGLPLAKAVVEAHNGVIEVDSELGRGTVFTMNFVIPTKM